MQIELAVEILEMAVAVDEPRQHRLAGDVDDVGIGRNVPALPDGFDSVAADDDGGILHRRAAGASISVPPLSTSGLAAIVLFSLAPECRCRTVAPPGKWAEPGWL